MNKDLRRFITKLMLLIVLTLVVVVAMFLSGMLFFRTDYNYGYTASLLDKVARLKSINVPKIILVGHSNLAFGIKSEMIEDAMNMPVVNLGLHGALGNAFHEEIAKLNINSGDIVIICHSDFSDDDKIDNVPLAWGTVKYNKELWEIIRFQDYPDMFQSFPAFWIRNLWSSFKPKETEDEVYSRRNFNKYGDIVKKPQSKRVDSEDMFTANKILVPQINDICVNRLNKFNEFVKSKGAIMLVAGYPIGYGKYTPPVEEYDRFQDELRERLECEVISDYTDYFIPYEYFYNSILHLDEEGTRIRTTQLIKDIKNWQARHH